MKHKKNNKKWLDVPEEYKPEENEPKSSKRYINLAEEVYGEKEPDGLDEIIEAGTRNYEVNIKDVKPKRSFGELSLWLTSIGLLLWVIFLFWLHW